VPPLCSVRYINPQRLQSTRFDKISASSSPRCSPTRAILGANPLRLVLVDPGERYLKSAGALLHGHKMKSTTCLSASTLALAVSRPLLPPFRSFSRLPQHPISTCMARKKVSTEELLARAEFNGHKRAHREKDCTQDLGKHRVRTKKDQDIGLDLYLM